MTSQTMKTLGIIFLVVAVLFAPSLIWARPIYIGDIYPRPADAIKRAWPLVSYLAKQLQPEGITDGKIVVVKTIPEMADLLKEKKVDLFIDSPFPAVAVSRLSGSKFLLRRWKKGVASYHTVIFVEKDSGINQLEDLKGKIIAFEEPHNTSSYFLPKLVLVQKGLKVIQKRGASDAVAPNEVGYLFAGQDPNTMFWVLKGKVSAGVMSNENYLLEARRYLNSLKVIHKTFTIPRHVLGYRADLDPKLVARIKEILIKMDQSEEGKKALQDFEKTTKFDEIPKGVLNPLLQSMKFIEAEFNIK